MSSNFFQVISALEHLEALSGERDAERSTIDSLQTQVKHLELEDSKKMEERQRNAKELEQGMIKMAAHLKGIGQRGQGEGRAQCSEQRKINNISLSTNGVKIALSNLQVSLCLSSSGRITRGEDEGPLRVPCQIKKLFNFKGPRSQGAVGRNAYPLKGFPEFAFLANQ